MKTKYTIIVTLLLALYGQVGIAQSIERSVIASAGETITDGNVTLDFTVGELAVTTITDGTTTLTQGFQQGVINLRISADVLVYLQGASFNPVPGEEALMRDDLRSGALIPLTSPYTEDAVSANSSVFDATGDNAIVDWVLVQLRDNADSNVIIASRSGLLQRDGDIVDVDGVSSLEFDERADNYYVSVNHRNHLGVISSQPIALGTSTNTVDFTAVESFAQGGALSVVLLSNGKYAMYSGDYDQNGQVQSTDLTPVISSLGNAGYSEADTDLNGQIQTIDLNTAIIPNIGRGQAFNN